MNPLMQNKPKDGMIIQVISQRNSIGANGYSHRLKMLKGSLLWDNPCPHQPSRVIILGENEVLLLFCPWKPQMIRGIVLKQGSRTRGLKPGIELPLL
jgi:hypothetical protein